MTLAPAYDVVPMAHRMDVDGRVALAVNGQYVRARLTAADLVAEASTWGVRRADRVVESTLDELRALIDAETPLDGAASHLHDRVRTYVGNLITGHRVGEAP